MGWLLTIWLILPITNDNLKFEMWFSRESYCKFAMQKFLESPVFVRLNDGKEGTATVSEKQCRELKDNELNLVPKHLRN